MTQQYDRRDESYEEPHYSWLNPLHWPVGIWVLMIVAFIMLLPFGIRALRLSGIPAGNAPFDVDEFVKWDVLSSEDAFTDYHEAVRLRERIVADLRSRSQSEPKDLDVVHKQDWELADEPLKQWLELHREAMTVWRRGTEKPQGMNLSPDKLAYDSLLNTVQEQRAFVYLAMLEQGRCIHDGQLDEAWQWARAANRCGGHTSHRGCIIQGLTGVAIHGVSTSGIARWAEQPGVTSDQLRAALAETKSDYRLYERTSNMLKSEYLAARNTLRNPNWLQIANPVISVDLSNRAVSTAMKMGYWVVGEPEMTMRIYRQVLANQITEVDKPMSSRRKMTGSGVAMLFDQDPAVSLPPDQLDAAAIDRIINRSSLARMLLPAVKHFESTMWRHAARQATIEVVLAAQAYRRDHGEFPESLSLLVPDYLEAVPLDPCLPGVGPLMFRRDETTSAVVWSVGADGTDEGGKVDATNGRPPDVGFLIRASSVPANSAAP